MNNRNMKPTIDDTNLDPSKPRVGQICTVYGLKCEIFKVHPAGTIDIVSLDGKKAWRISGLAFN